MDSFMPTLTRLGRLRIELRSLLGLAAPIMIAQLANTAMGFVDTVMAGRVSPRDLAAVALGPNTVLQLPTAAKPGSMTTAMMQRLSGYLMSARNSPLTACLPAPCGILPKVITWDCQRPVHSGHLQHLSCCHLARTLAPRRMKWGLYSAWTMMNLC